MLALKDLAHLKQTALVGNRSRYSLGDFMKLKYLCMGGNDATKEE